ncbi:hypothetical protein L1278_003501 [Pontibacter sp. HSC-36F09]|nr:hypothetical protein [Pontibacter sp. HSC-36F09]
MNKAPAIAGAFVLYLLRVAIPYFSSSSTTYIFFTSDEAEPM